MFKHNIFTQLKSCFYLSSQLIFVTLIFGLKLNAATESFANPELKNLKAYGLEKFNLEKSLNSLFKYDLNPMSIDKEVPYCKFFWTTQWVNNIKSIKLSLEVTDLKNVDSNMSDTEKVSITVPSKAVLIPKYLIQPEYPLVKSVFYELTLNKGAIFLSIETKLANRGPVGPIKSVRIVNQKTKQDLNCTEAEIDNR